MGSGNSSLVAEDV